VRVLVAGGRRSNDAILELTVDSVRQGGPAYQVGRGVAEVIADVERSDRTERGTSTVLDSLTPGDRSR
jgi:hypothetical protein